MFLYNTCYRYAHSIRGGLGMTMFCHCWLTHFALLPFLKIQTQAYEDLVPQPNLDTSRHKFQKIQIENENTAEGRRWKKFINCTSVVLHTLFFVVVIPLDTVDRVDTTHTVVVIKKLWKQPFNQGCLAIRIPSSVIIIIASKHHQRSILRPTLTNEMCTSK